MAEGGGEGGGGRCALDAISLAPSLVRGITGGPPYVGVLVVIDLKKDKYRRKLRRFEI